MILPLLIFLPSLIPGQDSASSGAGTSSEESAHTALEALDPAERAALDATFERFQSALRTKDAVSLAEVFDLESTVDLALRDLAGAASLHSAEERAELLENTAEGLLASENLRWDRLFLRGCRQLRGAHHYQLTTVLRGAPGAPEHAQWWVRRQAERFVLYDFALLEREASLRTTIGLTLAARHSSEGPGALKELGEQFHDALQGGDPERAASVVSAMRTAAPHSPFDVWVQRFETELQLFRGDFASALDRFSGTPRGDLGTELALGMALFDEHRDQDAQRVLQSFDLGFGGSASARQHLGDLCMRSDDVAAARAWYGSSLDIDQDRIACVYGLALCYRGDATHAAELQTRFTAVHRAPQEFDHLAETLLDADRENAVLVLCEGLAALEPQNADVGYYRAAVYLEQGRFEEARTVLEEALPHAPDDQREAFLAAHTHALLGQRSPVDAYRESLEPSVALDVTAHDALGAKDWTSLQQIADLHHQAFPDDPWPYYYLGEMYWAREELELADQNFEVAMERAAQIEADLRDLLRSERVQCLAFFGELVRAYKTVPPRDTTFQELVQWCIDQEDGASLAPLVAARALDDPQDPTVPLLAGYAAFRALEFDLAWRAFAPHLDRLVEGSDWLADLENAALRSALRIGEGESALELARRSTQRDGDPYYEAVVLGVLGRTEEAREVIERCLNAGYEAAQFAQDTDLGPRILEDAAWAPFRARYLE